MILINIISEILVVPPNFMHVIFLNSNYLIIDFVHRVHRPTNSFWNLKQVLLWFFKMKNVKESLCRHKNQLRNNKSLFCKIDKKLHILIDTSAKTAFLSVTRPRLFWDGLKTTLQVFPISNHKYSFKLQCPTFQCAFFKHQTLYGNHEEFSEFGEKKNLQVTMPPQRSCGKSLDPGKSGCPCQDEVSNFLSTMGRHGRKSH